MKRWLWIGAAVAVVALVALLVVVISGRSSGGGGIGVYQAWVRSTAASQTNAAVYATVKNGDDRQNAVVGAQVPSSVAMSTRLHQTMTGGNDSPMKGGGNASAEDDMTHMQEVRTIPIAANATVHLAPGGYHVMLVDLAKPLVKGEDFDVTFRFRRGGAQTVAVTVR